MEDEEMETSVLKSDLIQDPDLLSDVSDMKQDLIKMTAILTADSPEKSTSLRGCNLEKGTEDVAGEPLEIMEKDLEKVKEDLEKVGEILRSGTYEGEAAEETATADILAEDWVLLSDSELKEARKMAALDIQEPVLRESRANRGAPRPKAIKDSSELKEYLLDAPVSSKVKAKKENPTQERFTDVVLRQRAKPTTLTKVQDKTTAGNVKKPVRRKGKDQGKEGESTEALLSVPTAPDRSSPVSPVVEETPIGSIKDKVKALQQKVEAEQKSKKVTGSKPSQVPVMSKPAPKAKESPKSKQDPSKFPKTGAEKREETMSVKELMQAFETGPDPSKTKSGLCELKPPTISRSEKTTKSETIQSKSMTKAITSRIYKEPEVSLDSNLGKKETIQQDGEKETKSVTASQPELSETVDFGNGGLDDSSDSSKHEGVADSLIASSGDESPHLSSEDSHKHEGLATPGTSPETLCLSPKSIHKTSQTVVSTAATMKKESTETEQSGDSGVRTAADQMPSVLTLPVSSNDATDDQTTSEFITAMRRESKPIKPQSLTKTISAPLEMFLSDNDSSDCPLALPLAGSPASRSSYQHHESLDLPLKQDSDALSPLADDSLTISHRDSLDGSPLMEENSSHQSPDSIEPSPTKESPCHDSLESSPVEQQSHPSFPSTLDPPNISSSHPEPSNALPQDALHGRLIRDHEGSIDDDSCEPTSQMTSSGKSPLSPDTPSSEEVSYEVNPKTPDLAFLSVQSKSTIIPEDPEEDDTSDISDAKRKFTPEEEMFKMAAKIKTFDEMEQDARSQKYSRKDMFPLVDSKLEDDSYETLQPTSEKLSNNEHGLNRPTEDSKLAHFVDPHNKVQPPSGFSAGLHDGCHRKDMKNTTTEGPPSVSDQQHVESELKQRVQPSADTDSPNKKAAVTSNSENRTDEQKEATLRRSTENKGDDGGGKELGGSKLQSAVPKKASNVTDEVKEDQKGLSGAQKERVGGNVATGQTKETCKPVVCIYDDTEDDDESLESPRTESKGVTARENTDLWSALREDDDAFAARVKEEEQKIMNLAVDQCLQATPDTTPGRTPTEESTPTSEPNPFLFQEGKLFEMTRSGAIDMTKRSYEEEGGGFAFFQIGEQPLAEPALEEAGKEGTGPEAEPEVGLNLTLEVETEDDEKLKERIDSQPQSAPDVDQTTSKTDASKSKNPKMGLSASPKPTKKDQTSPEGLEAKYVKTINEGSSDLETSSPDQMTVNVKMISLHSEQTQDSSDFSPDEHQSATQPSEPIGTCRQSTSRSLKKTTVKTEALSAPPGRGKSSIPCPSHTASSSSPLKKETSFESKSKIPIKAGSLKSDATVKHVESTQDKKLKVPVKKDTRTKCETDEGPTVDVKAKIPSSKAKSFCEGESDRPAAKKEVGHPTDAEPAKSKSFQSRLPIRGKSGQSSHSSTLTKKTCEPCKPSEEKATSVERLTQAETTNCDDESSLMDSSVIERGTWSEVQFPPSGDLFPITPLWDDPVETQMQRIPDDKVQSPGIPQLKGLFSVYCADWSTVAGEVLLVCLTWNRRIHV